MSTENNNQQLGLLIKELLEQRSWSMGRLSDMTKIDKATISRIVNGKRKANLQHLQKFAEAFEVSMHDLMKSAGYEVDATIDQKEAEVWSSLESVQNFLDDSELAHKKISRQDIEEELEKYRRVAGTEEGEILIRDGFEVKLQKIGSAGPYIDQLKEMFLKFRLKKAPAAELGLIGSALIYFILPIDLIPDYIFAVGYLDDAIAVQFVMNMLPMKD